MAKEGIVVDFIAKDLNELKTLVFKTRIAE